MVAFIESKTKTYYLKKKNREFSVSSLLWVEIQSLVKALIPPPKKEYEKIVALFSKKGVC